MKFAFAIALCCSLGSFAVRAQPAGDAQFFQKYQLAQISDARGDFQNAARLYAELYQAQPENPDVIGGYVHVLTMLKRFATADTILTEALSHPSEQSYDLYLMLGRTRSFLGHKSEALEAFHSAIQSATDQNPYSVTYAVSNIMAEVGYTEEALALLQSQRKTEADGQFYTPLIADMLFKLGRYDVGTKEYLSMLRSNERSASVENVLASVEGRIAHFIADTASSRAIVRTIIAQIDTDDATIPELRLLGWCYGELRDYGRSLDVALMIENRGEHTGNGFDLIHFADKALSEGAFDAATRAYTEVVNRAGSTGGAGLRSELYYEAKLGILRSRLAALTQHVPFDGAAIRAVVSEYANLGASGVPNPIAVEALALAGDAALATLHDPAMAKPYYEQIVARSQSFSTQTRDAYFSLETIALAQNDLDGARNQLAALSAQLDRRHRADDIEIRRHIEFEHARIFYFEGRFDTALATLEPIIAVPSSEYANDAIALQSLITENREGSDDGAMRVFAKAELLSLGSDLGSALAGYQSIKQTYPTAAIADEATLRAADLLLTLGKASDAVNLLEDMQEKMTDSPLLDRAALREAEITEHDLHAKDKALKLYEDFLARYPKSPLCTEVRQRARRLRGDVF